MSKLVLSLVVLLFCQGAFAQGVLTFVNGSRSLKEAQESGAYIPLLSVPFSDEQQEVVVPTDYGDIQAALVSGARNIRVLPGVYVGSLRIAGERWIYADKPGSVLIISHNIENTIQIASGSTVILQGLRIVNAQTPGPYNRANIFAEFGGSLALTDCEIYTTSIGLSVNYLESTSVVYSRFFGSQDATAIMISHSNPLRAGGTTLIGNSFFAIGTGIDGSSSYHRFKMCDEEPQPCDSNNYFYVARPFVPQRELID